jgi:hypothetical protein
MNGQPKPVSVLSTDRASWTTQSTRLQVWRSESVLGPTASEDRHATRPNKQSGGDQDDAQDQLALDQLHNADNDKDGGDNPQNGCTHGAILTLGSSVLSPCCRAACARVGCSKWSDSSAVSQLRLAAGVPARAEAATTRCAILRTAEPGLMRALASTRLVSLPGTAAPRRVRRRPRRAALGPS